MMNWEDHRKVKALVAQRGLTVNALLKTLLKAELASFETLDARINLESPEVYEMGFIPKRENPEENPRPRDVDALTRDTRPRTLDRPGWR